jgi:hypothetical protein
LGQLIGIAFNNPKEYPRLSKLLPKAATYDKQKMEQEAAAHGLRVP